MKTVSLTIDGKNVNAREGDKLLWVALDSGIYIPNLCALRDAKETAADCRLCFVEVAGYSEPVVACAESVWDGMVVETKGPRALRLARTSFELLLASHPVDCAHCPVSGTCELQKIAHHLGVKLNSKRFRKILHQFPVDDSSTVLTYDPNKCVLCGRCVWICRERLGIGVLGFAHRGFGRIVTTFAHEPLVAQDCQGCGECALACPTGALVLKEQSGVVKCCGKESVA